MNKYAEDCIHLKACRRARIIAKQIGIKGGYLSLACNEKCSAYVSGDIGNYVSAETAVNEARHAFSSVRSGYGDDCLVESDLPGMTLGEIVACEYDN